MKKGLMASYLDGIVDFTHGESYGRIMRYFLPEFVTALLLYSLPIWVDAYFISRLQSTSLYSTLGATNNLLHLILKIAEGVSVGTIILAGRHNGAGDFKAAGRTIRDAFWVTILLGVSFSSMLYFGAHYIYSWYVPAELVDTGAAFLQLRAFGVFFMFVFFAFIGFLRGLKDARTPMCLYVVGSITFLLFDYLLIFGNYGFPEMGLYGSALASIIQYGLMLLLAMVIVFCGKKYRKYSIELFSGLSDVSYWKELIKLSIPVIIDKAMMAIALVWLLRLIKSLGACGVASFCIIKDLERVALLPAVAFAQVITFLVSNDLGAKNWDGVKSNIKKILFLATIMVFTIIILFSCYTTFIVKFFDTRSEFTHVAAQVFPVLGFLVFFDVLQIILSGALRGLANVKVVMWVRFLVLSCYFFPVSYVMSQLAIDDPAVKIILIFGSYYTGNALMSFIYVNRFRGNDWKKS
ncbi:MAG TPA: MATE family efflux transporter [Candidatus Babeliales bacterium]|nr:MATE family efflux transporter [Candidatus Babeliales bacterium]